MPPLPVELIEEIIDIVAECYPESLPDCALVSHEWNPRSTHHLYRIFRTPTVTTYGGLHAFMDIVKKHPRLATFATSLEVAPDPELNLPYASYVPFHHLSSNLLPNVRRLVLGETLRWRDYPLLYRNGTFGFAFYRVTTLDLSCQFTSISDLSRAIRSFRNVEEVRIIYPHDEPPQWMFSDQTHTSLRRGLFSRETHKLQNLEISVRDHPRARLWNGICTEIGFPPRQLEILKPVLDICGDSVVNLSVICPQMSAVSMDGVEGNKQLGSAYSLTSLQTVKVTVPVESASDRTNHAGLRKLPRFLIAPIIKRGVRYSLFLVQCPEHNTVGYRVEGISMTRFRQLIQNLAKADPGMEECQECRKRDDPQAVSPEKREHWSEDEKSKPYLYPPSRTLNSDTNAPLTALFLKLLILHGDNFRQIAASMPQKTTEQVEALYRADSRDLNLGKMIAESLARPRSPRPTLEDGLEGYLGSRFTTATRTVSNAPRDGNPGTVAVASPSSTAAPARKAPRTRSGTKLMRDSQMHSELHGTSSVNCHHYMLVSNTISCRKFVCQGMRKIPPRKHSRRIP
ncbi:hypothetical protein LXA43DRAFT_705086 [Ganoderma leucocontextum]|nr:hypothetical protein LXA43DRAFT_705086 [Ganoderma leucocontextum]